MPKETIHDEASLWDIQVGWNGQGSVQLGIESADHRTIIDHLCGDVIGREKLDELLGDGRLPAFTGLWGNLDRDRLNELIRVLRKARDRSFGRDE